MDGSVIGWALVYLPWMPHGFYFGTSLKPEASWDVLSSLYLSVVTLATLGFGDITPAAPALRLITPAEALIGFVLLSAVISWVLQVYPALGRRRAFASELSIMAASDARDVVENGEAHVATSLLHPLTRSLIGVTVDLSQYAESYYFWESKSRMSLPANLPVVVALILANRRSPHPEVHKAGAALERAAPMTWPDSSARSLVGEAKVPRPQTPSRPTLATIANTAWTPNWNCASSTLPITAGAVTYRPVAGWSASGTCVTGLFVSGRA